MSTLPERINGKLPKYTSVGSYPVFYVSNMDCVLCAECSTAVLDDPMAFGNGESLLGCDVNWEDPHMYCEECNVRIESAYADDEVTQP